MDNPYLVSHEISNKSSERPEHICRPKNRAQHISFIAVRSNLELRNRLVAKRSGYIVCPIGQMDVPDSKSANNCDYVGQNNIS